MIVGECLFEVEEVEVLVEPGKRVGSGWVWIAGC